MGTETTPLTHSPGVERPTSVDGCPTSTRPWFEHRLGAALSGVPQVHDLLDRPGARILDVSCGAGWSTIALARAYPGARIVALDIDEPSIDTARRRARQAGVDGRVELRVADVAGLSADGFDGAFAFECLHDMS